MASQTFGRGSVPAIVHAGVAERAILPLRKMRLRHIRRVGYVVVIIIRVVIIVVVRAQAVEPVPKVLRAIALSIVFQIARVAEYAAFFANVVIIANIIIVRVIVRRIVRRIVIIIVIRGGIVIVLGGAPFDCGDRLG
jgi:hypothetical protein